jgi:hypothetical protein
VSPNPHIINFSTKKEFDTNFEMGIAIRGKDRFSETWHDVYNSGMTNTLNKVSITCPFEVSSKTKVCDTFELGIIGHLDYSMYDIAIMITKTPEDLLTHDYGTLSFRISHLNDDFMSWLARVRISCLIITGLMILIYFFSSCGREGFSRMACLTFNLDQYWVISLLFMCAIFDEPLFELRRNRPSETLAVLSEIPVSLFFTALLTYWLMGVTLVRVKAKNLQDKRKATLRDIVGVFSFKRLVFLIVLLLAFVIV